MPARHPIPVIAALSTSLALVTACGAASTAAMGPPDVAEAAIVEISTGALRGTAGAEVHRFRGIPYAAPPVDDLRYAPPQPAQAWAGERDATGPGPVCAQPSTGDPAFPVRGVEDCLTVDVTVPADPSAQPRPVLVWLHGGGLSTGDGAELDPTRMVAQGDVVVVSVESRLGPLGFLGHPDLGAEAGTLGFADQQAALRWVDDEIAAFGGDPERVVVGGQSGGSVGACVHLVSPQARDLIDGAILQSGSCADIPAISTSFLPPTRYVDSPGESTGRALDVVGRLGCGTAADTAACLRAVPLERIVAAGADVTFAAWGGPLLPEDPEQALRNPAAVADVPVLSGQNRDEGVVFAQTYDLLQDPVMDENLGTRLSETFAAAAQPPDLDELAAAYPRAEFPTAGHLYAAVTGDALFACPQLALTDRLAAREQPVFAYEFADRTSPGYVPILDTYRNVGAAHAAELVHLFDIQDKPIDVTGTPRPLDEAQRELGDRMIEAWSGFLHSGDPGWAPYTRADPTVQSFATGPDGVGPIDSQALHRCGVWNG